MKDNGDEDTTLHTCDLSPLFLSILCINKQPQQLGGGVLYFPLAIPNLFCSVSRGRSSNISLEKLFTFTFFPSLIFEIFYSMLTNYDGYGCLDGLIMIFMCMFCSFMLCYYLMRFSENDSHASVVCFVVFLLFY